MPDQAELAVSLPERLSAKPTKRFFVSMLTRDIELQDAVLDLLDNCIDGVIRENRNRRPNPERPYEGFYAHITMLPDRFEVVDNCGGIPHSTLDKAFRMGRPPDAAPPTGSTVGMYGIGMKRAVFKLGTSCSVASRHQQVGFVVSISPAWMEDENDWDLPVTPLGAEDPLTNGTRVVVDLLRSDVSPRFDESADSFVGEFRQILSQHYSMIIEKGFEVRLNGRPVGIKPFSLLSRVDNVDLTKASLRPYFFRAKMGSVNVEIYAGIYRALPDEAEMEKEEEQRASRDDAGWTIACNDRVVVYRDKTRLTGWGEANVPNFHGQFNSFSGLVILSSDQPLDLPLTTTKRGIDPSSEVYSVVKDYMREATKYFTNFTNKWKRLPAERESIYRESESLELGKLRAVAASFNMNEVRKLKDANAFRFTPSLPVPQDPDKAVRISFARSPADVRAVAKYLFGDEEVDPRKVGEQTFDDVLSSAKSAS